MWKLKITLFLAYFLFGHFRSVVFVRLWFVPIYCRILCQHFQSSSHSINSDCHSSAINKWRRSLNSWKFFLLLSFHRIGNLFFPSSKLFDSKIKAPLIREAALICYYCCNETYHVKKTDISWPIRGVESRSFHCLMLGHFEDPFSDFLIPIHLQKKTKKHLR